jgi:hypothetical protein
MRTRTLPALLALIGIAVSACAAEPAPTAKKGADTCVFYSALYDWQALDDSNLVVWVPGKDDAYHVSLTMPLPGLKSAFRLGFVDGTQDGRLCSFGRDAITLGDDSTLQRSTIRSIEHLTADTLVQLEEKYEVKLKRESRRKARPKVPDRETTQ